ncbi:MAG: Hypothetical protein C75L2_00380129 [Leptospirillum sp. Group II 'C75']|uniref:Uncharacterized protein n=2 Tax=Leptospirillum TaxID=179 RepID=A0A1V3SXQ6_9BACT|nr:hypothetical protein ABH19_09795 [Leptospirillum sp. Group II 'CF-1']EDZ38117.1 MAG: Hypothetical protein CGL2_11390054 [Leptospirillum sp. Group II '5-way CG']EIJ76764.1 MAG: Hypothetical protein C75L2_00380129 [Leptospirillum sp. Group II 'C75']OOH74376.1 hypothetical protein BOX24_01950 [Leptospirillum ferriphilum]
MRNFPEATRKIRTKANLSVGGERSNAINSPKGCQDKSFSPGTIDFSPSERLLPPAYRIVFQDSTPLPKRFSGFALMD